MAWFISIIEPPAADGAWRRCSLRFRDTPRLGAHNVLRQRAPAPPGMEQDKIIASPKPVRNAGEDQTSA
jgi:hypothetical protein